MLSTENAHPTYQTGANILTVSGELDFAQTYTDLRMQDGQIVRIPTALLIREGNSASYSSGTPTKAIEGRPVQDLVEGEATVIPLVEETLEVMKRIVPTGTVRLQKTVQEYQETLDEPLAVRTFDVERIIVNQPVEHPPAVRHEGDTTIYSLVEEQLILTKQLILKEEVRVTQRDTERRDNQIVTLRREHMTIERESQVRG
jgi:uncharacterized protein (TIGR02271 family)